MASEQSRKGDAVAVGGGGGGDRRGGGQSGHEVVRQDVQQMGSGPQAYAQILQQCCRKVQRRFCATLDANAFVWRYMNKSSNEFDLEVLAGVGYMWE